MKYFPETLPKLVIRHIGSTAYDSYIAETLYPLKSAIKLTKQTRFAGDPVSSVKTIPARRTRSHPPKWTIKAGDPDLLIPIELSQARAESDLNQDLGGDLSVVSLIEKDTNLKRPSQQYHWANSKLKGVTTTSPIALLIMTPIHPPENRKYCNSRDQHTLPKRNIL